MKGLAAIGPLVGGNAGAIAPPADDGSAPTAFHDLLVASTPDPSATTSASDGVGAPGTNGARTSSAVQDTTGATDLTVPDGSATAVDATAGGAGTAGAALAVAAAHHHQTGSAQGDPMRSTATGTGATTRSGPSAGKKQPSPATSTLEQASMSPGAAAELLPIDAPTAATAAQPMSSDTLAAAVGQSDSEAATGYLPNGQPDARVSGSQSASTSAPNVLLDVLPAMAGDPTTGPGSPHPGTDDGTGHASNAVSRCQVPLVRATAARDGAGATDPNSSGGASASGDGAANGSGQGAPDADALLSGIADGVAQASPTGVADGRGNGSTTLDPVRTVDALSPKETAPTTPGAADVVAGPTSDLTSSTSFASAMVAVGASTHTAPTSHLGALGAAPASTADLPGVASQLVSVLTPLRPTGGGGIGVTIALHPAGLGNVTATLSLNDGQLTVRLAASTAAGAHAIRDALPELRSGLADASTHANVVLADQGGSAYRSFDDRTPQPEVAASGPITTDQGSAGDDDASSTPTLDRVGASSLLDVRL